MTAKAQCFFVLFALILNAAAEHRSAAIDGVVVNSLTGAPLKRAHVSLWPIHVPHGSSYGADTDATGHFLFDDLPPGTYSLTGMRSGFLNQSYSKTGRLNAATLLTTSSGEKLNIVFKLTPQAVISGVIDPEGDPMPHAQLHCLTYRYGRDGKELNMTTMGISDEEGEFRLAGLQPGRYVVSAKDESAQSQPSEDHIVGDAARQGYAITYYPSVTDPRNAAYIDVSPGAQIGGVVIALVPVHLVNVGGRVIWPQAVNVQGPKTVWMFPRKLSLSPRTPTRIDENGNFEFRGVPPGSYDLIADCSYENQRSVARVPIEVGDHDITDLSIRAMKAGELSGRLTVEDKRALKGLTPEILLVPRFQRAMAGAPSANVKGDLSFKLINIAPDLYDVELSGYPENFYIKTIRMAAQDVTFSGIDLTQGIPPGELVVTLSPHAGQIEGVVRDSKGDNAADMRVTLVPAVAHDVYWLYRSANTDQNGRFLLKGIRPGDYAIYAWEEIEPGADHDPDFIKSHESAGKKITIHDDDRQSVELTEISASVP